MRRRAPYYFALVLSAGWWVTGTGVSSQSGGQTRDEDFRFRPDHERENLREDSAYRKFQVQEGIPVHTGFAANVYTVKLAPWKRLGAGVMGAFIDLEGSGGLVDVQVWEMPVGAQTRPERHLYDENVIVLRGEGETHIWQTDPAKKVVVPWRRGTVFAPPVNTWHQHINKGREPSRMAASTDLPLKIDIFRSRDFMFGTNYNFIDRYNGQADYFDPEKSVDYSPKTDHALSLVNLIRDAWTWRLFHAGQGYGDIDRHFILSDNSLSGHIEAWPVGAYQRAHAHGPGATIVHLGGAGYSLLWPRDLGATPWKDGKGDKVSRVDWQEGTVIIPPIQWYHQHFATGPENAKFIKLGTSPNANPRYRVTSGRVMSGGNGHLIPFKEEDPYVRRLFEQEVTKAGAKVLMPPMKELIAVEEECGPDAPIASRVGCGRIPPIEGSTVR
jgi:quercetin dioxygenase-like cupin family protein